MKLFFKIVLFFFLISCKNNTPPKTTLSSKPNVLFIIADDLNCDLGCYGNTQVKSPNIDGLAQKGIVFENAHNQYPLCGPSRASFMSGMYTDQTKITQNNIHLRSTVPDVVTIGQRFRQQGYQSVRIGKIFHYDNPSSIGTSGFDDIYSWDKTINPYGRDKLEEHKINTLSPRRYGGTLSWLAAEGKDEEQTDGIGASEAIDLLDGFSKSGENFFLAVGMYRPHTPFVAPKKYFDLYDQDAMNIPKSSDEYLQTLPTPSAKSVRAKKNQLNLEEDLAKEIKEAYYATTSFVDAQVGRILKKLEESGLAENTIVVFTSDHGYHLGEHGHWQKQTLFENSTRVPLIFAGPGVENTKIKTNSPVELLDIYPTLMDLTNIEVPDHVVGKTLAPLFKNEKQEIRAGALTKWRNGYSLKTTNYRITQWGENGELGYELYDHSADLSELTNLASNSNYKNILDELTIVLNNRIKEAGLIPKGVGRQIEGVKPMKKPNGITFGDLYDKHGKRIKDSTVSN